MSHAQQMWARIKAELSGAADSEQQLPPNKRSAI